MHQRATNIGFGILLLAIARGRRFLAGGSHSLKIALVMFGAHFMALSALELLFLGNYLRSYRMDFYWDLVPDAARVVVYFLGGFALIMIARARSEEDPRMASRRLAAGASCRGSSIVAATSRG